MSARAAGLPSGARHWEARCANGQCVPNLWGLKRGWQPPNFHGGGGEEGKGFRGGASACGGLLSYAAAREDRAAFKITSFFGRPTLTMHICGAVTAYSGEDIFS